MLSHPGRNGRRRRVLKEEVLSASSSHVAMRAMRENREPDHVAPRYSDAASVENHPQITDFIPRRYSTIAMLVLTGALTTAALGSIHYFAVPIATAAGLTDVGHLAMSAPGSLATWVAAVLLLVAAATCILVYSIRRHRIDDFRGRYRIWLAAALVCVLASANSVAALHNGLAQTLSFHTGWTMLRGGAIWWLTIVGLPVAWIAVRLLVDVKESRVAATILVGAFVSYIALISAADPRIASLVCGAASLFGSWLLLAAVVAYARFVVLDAQGLIPIVRFPARPKVKESPKVTAVRSDEPAPPPSKLAPSIFPAASRQKPKPSNTEWTDGRHAERERYDDDDHRAEKSKLSKSERKRLRKLKARNRAA
jgi:MFS family permease